MSIFEDFKRKGIITKKYDIVQRARIKKEPYFDIEKEIEENTNLDDWKKLRDEMSLSEWINLILISIGYNPKSLNSYEKVFTICRLLPFCKNNYHMIELGGAGTGKSFTYEGYTEHSINKSGSLTLPDIFGGTPTTKDPEEKKKVGLIGECRVLAFDEIAEQESLEGNFATKLRSYMSNGNSSRNDLVPRYPKTSIVFVGNLKSEQEKLYDESRNIENINLLKYFPEEIKSDPVKNRISFLIPGWLMKRTARAELETSDTGININYLFRYLIELRDENYENLLENINHLDNELGTRGVDSILATVEGLIKILYPNGKINPSELKALVDIANFGKNLVHSNLLELESDDFYNFILSIITGDLKKEKKIEEVYIDSERIYIKYENENHFYKVALTLKGEKQNHQEIKNYEIATDKKIENYFLKVDSISNKNFILIMQEYLEPNKKLRKLHLLETLKEVKIDFEKISDENTKKIMKEVVEKLEKENEILKRKTEDLEEKIRVDRKEINKMKDLIEEYLRNLKLDFLELQMSSKDEERIDSRANFFSFEKKKFIEKDIIIKEAEEITGLDFKTISKKNYIHTDDGRVKLINYYDIF